MDKEKAVQETCLEAIESGIVNSAHDCSEGGLAIALTESCVSNKKKMLGAKIKIVSDIRKDAILFGEAPSRIVISIGKDKINALEKVIKKYSIPYSILGNVGGKNLTIQCDEETLIELPVAALSDTWRNAIPSRLSK